MIKKLIVTALLAFVVASLAGLWLRQWYLARLPPPPEELPRAVIVYCFHGNARGPKCDQIERSAHEVLKKSFAVPLKDGRLVWRVLNFEDPKNARFKDDCQIGATCIVVVDARSGGAHTAKNLQQKVWELVDDKQALADFLHAEIEKSLK